MAILFAREGALVLCVDRHLASAAETVAMIAAEGGQAAPFQADVSGDAGCAAIIAEAKTRLGRIDILVNNVGIGGGGDGPADRAKEEAFDRILTVNLKSAWMTIKHASAGHARTGLWVDRQHLLAGLARRRHPGRLRGFQGGHEPAHHQRRQRQCRPRRALQRGAARSDGYADGGERDRGGDGIDHGGSARGPQRPCPVARQDG